MFNSLLLKLFVLLNVVRKCDSAGSAFQNQKYFKKVTSHGKYNTTMYIGWVAIGIVQRIDFTY